MKFVEGGVCAPKGFKAAGIHCGIRKNKDKKDLSLILSDTIASAGAVYTTNLVKGAPIAVTKANISDGRAIGMICNSGNANTCNSDGIEIAEKMCQIAAEATGNKAQDFIVASTGVIGQPLSIEPIAAHMDELVESLSYTGSQDAAYGIMTTDTKLKEVAVEFELGGKVCRIGGIAKGSGMIHPNMATMLVFVTSDVAIDSSVLSKVLKENADDTFNMVSVDGDTSTNDMLSIMANGMAGNDIITEGTPELEIFKEALLEVTKYLSRMIAKDGEGATKLLECQVRNAASVKDAKILAKSVICSSLVKAAMFGADANWGRILCALGYAGTDADVTKIDVAFRSCAGAVRVCKNGSGIDFSEEIAKTVLTEDEIIIDVNMNAGNGNATAWGCDLTYDYVKINGDYRT
ncbi:MAG: bifunctional ornithine acetyltransferase/N-acetylglutamate synthase [Ruminococcaceae bacterium]|nr:bifunctional ornithine acetyltransferase/N-acetylglutamate synthase [Oscillospiraceae bacterium]